MNDLVNRFNYKKRHHQEEIMDDLQLWNEEVKNTLINLDRINNLFGGTKLFISSCLNIIYKKSYAYVSSWNILDIGCGSGDSLNKLAQRLEKNNINYLLKGVDANRAIAQYATSITKANKNIKIVAANIFDDIDLFKNIDIVHGSLFFHHLTDEEILLTLKRIEASDVKAIIINDLHRNRIAFSLFKIIAPFLNLTSMAKKDGAISIKRGFTKKDFDNISLEMKNWNYSIKWKWAFRYQVILWR